MLWTNTKRVVKAGFVNFWRNGFVSISSIFVMVITLLVIGSIIFTTALLNSTLQQIKDKVDINIYFVTSAAEPDVLAIKKSLEARPDVQLVTYTSSDQALADFKTRHANDEFTLQALDELQSNPLGAVLNVKANDPSEYQGIADFLQSKSVSPDNGLPIIDKINYNQNKVAIDKLTNIINGGKKVGLILTIILVAISILITFNTIRLAIYISREEISIMRLVGASSKYVRGPFVIIGIMYGVIASLLASGIFYPVTYYLGPHTEIFGVNIFTYYIQNFGQIFVLLLGAGVVIGAVSSYLAVRRYLRV